MVRFKNRYLLLELIFHPTESPSPPTAVPSLTERNFVDIVRESLQVNFGDVGAAQAGGPLVVKYYSPTTSLLILRCARDNVAVVRAAVTFIRQIKGRDVIIRALHVGGTIRKTQEAAIGYDRNLILKGRLLLDASEQAAFDQRQKALLSTEP